MCHTDSIWWGEKKGIVNNIDHNLIAIVLFQDKIINIVVATVTASIVSVSFVHWLYIYIYIAVVL